jgi:hypothetical protein
MPRQAKLDVPGVLYHIMLRGIIVMAAFQPDKT